MKKQPIYQKRKAERNYKKGSSHFNILFFQYINEKNVFMASMEFFT